MTDTIQSISQSLRVDIATLNTISNNVANTNTPGFRAERSMPGFQAHLGDGPSAPSIDQKDGPLAMTGRPLDLALRGHGFFQVQRGEQVLLARGGDFRLDANGHVVNTRGDFVLGDGGPLSLVDTAVRIDSKGAIWAGDKPLGSLKIVDVADPSRLGVVDGGFRYDGQLATWKGSVQQGAIEHSNVDVAGESVRLMELTRHVESLQHAMSIYDQAMETGINRLGD